MLQSIPKEQRSENLYELDLDRDQPSVERWCIKTGAFKFKLEVKEKPHTERGMLSIISSVYDPLGPLAALILAN